MSQFAVTFGSGKKGIGTSISALGTSTSVAAVFRVRGSFLTAIAANGSAAIGQIGKADFSDARITWRVERDSGNNISLKSSAAGFGGMPTANSLDVTTIVTGAFYRIYCVYNVSPAQYNMFLADDAGTIVLSESHSSFGVALDDADAAWGAMCVNGNFYPAPSGAASFDWAAAYTARRPDANRFDTPSTGDTSIVAYYQFNEGTGLSAADSKSSATMTLDSGTTWTQLDAPLDSMTVSLSPNPAMHGGGFTANATLFDASSNILDPANYAAVVWTSDDTAIATVNSASGAGSALTDGTCHIVATIGGITANLLLTVIAPSPVAYIHASIRRDPVITQAEAPRRTAITDISVRAPTGGSISASPGDDLGALMYANPDKTIIATPGVYPATVWKKPAGHGPTTIMTSSSLSNRQYQIADKAALVQITPGVVQPATTCDIAEPPYNVNFLGLYADAPAGDQPNTFLPVMDFGSGVGDQHAVRNIPRGIVLDSCVVTTPSTAWRRFGIIFNGADMGMIRSSISNIHYQDWPAGFDSNALAIYCGPGPFTIRQTYLEGAEETATGGDTGNDGFGIQQRVSDITYDLCRFARSPSFRALRQCKNGTEWKQGTRLKVSNSIIEHVWRDVQQLAFAVLAWSVQPQSWCGTSDIIYDTVWARNVGGLMSFDANYSGESNAPLVRVIMRNIIATGFSDPTLCTLPSDGVTGNDRILQLGNSRGNSIDNILVEKVLAFNRGNGANEWLRGSVQARANLVIRSCLGGIASGGHVAVSTAAFGSNFGTVSFESICDAASSSWNNNVIVDPDSGVTRPYYEDGANTRHNYYPASIEALMMVDPSVLTNTAAVLADLAGLKLQGGSPYKGVAHDGSDPGPDIDAFIAALANVPTGA